MKNKLTLPILVIGAILTLFVPSCNVQEQEETETLIDQTLAKEFFTYPTLKSSDKRSVFITKAIDAIKNYNDTVNFVPGFVENLGYADWQNNRWFETEKETVLQVPVYGECDTEVKGLIVVAEDSSAMFCYVIKREALIEFIDKHNTELKLEKLIDLFILADFKVFGYSSFLPDGEVNYTNESCLKSVVIVETCYNIDVFIGGKLISSRVECEYSASSYITKTTLEMEDSGGTAFDGFTGLGGHNGNSNNSTNDNPDITEELDQYPCASDVLDKMKNLNTDLANLISYVFDIDITINMNFIADNSLSGTSLSGTAVPNNNLGLDPNEVFNFDVRLNPDILNDATQEYILVTYIHEAIHCLIDYYRIYDPEKGKELFPIFFNPTLTIDPKDISYFEARREHETMARLYINKIAEMIIAFNPSFPLNKAEHLAWGGLHDTWAYRLKKNASIIDEAGNNIFEKNVLITNRAEKTSSTESTGTKCKD